MDFYSLTLFLLLYYVRPHEWPALSGIAVLRPVTLVMIFAITTMFAKNKNLSRSDFFKTPHDWIVFFYCIWMVLTARDTMFTFHVVYPLYFFYIVTVQALSSTDRIRRFLNWWTVMILAIAALAILSNYGFDPTDAQRITEGRMKGRQSLGTKLFNNPNALGHSIVPVILMLYFLFIWKRPIFVRIGALPLFVLPIYCIYLTYSKGAFVSGFAAIVASLTFGRPKTVQIFILVGALTVGWAGVQTLPRMQELENAQDDEAIRGRLEAFKFGRQMVVQKLTGLGKDTFVQSMMEYRGYYKAAHSSYVAVGGELGMPGFFMFLAILYCCMRSLITAKTRDVTEERVRRILFAMLISYMASSWMVDFAYRGSLFMNFAAVAAFHRLLLKKHETERHGDETVQEAFSAMPSMALGGMRPAMATGAPMLIDQSTITNTTINIPATKDEDVKLSEEEQAVAPGLSWNKFGAMDWLMAALFTFAAYMFWGYVMLNL